MFCYAGISPEQVDAITKKHHVYMTKDGRISMAGASHRQIRVTFLQRGAHAYLCPRTGVTPHNIKHLAQALHDVTK